MNNEDTYEYKMFKMLDEIIADISPMDISKEMWEKANDLLDEYCCLKLREINDEDNESKS